MGRRAHRTAAPPAAPSGYAGPTRTERPATGLRRAPSTKHPAAPLRLRAAALWLAGMTVAAGACNAISGVDDIDFSGAPCTTDADCTDSDPCGIDSCSAQGVCTITPVADGPALQQIAGDCKTAACSGGSAVYDDDPADEDDLNPCTLDACEPSGASHAGVDDGTPCQLGAATGTCAAGTCAIACSDSSQCDDRQPCTIDSCDLRLQTCVYQPNHGALVDDTSATDCVQLVCNETIPVSLPDDSEIPDDENVCTADACVGGRAVHTPKGGRPCGAGICDERGACVGCEVAEDCEGTDDDCKQRSCKGGVCGVSYAPSGTALANQADGDCKQAVCDGSGGTTMIADVVDVPPDDGNPCTVAACQSTTPSQQPLAQDTPCPMGYCNAIGACVQCNSNAQCPMGGTCVSSVCKKSLGQMCITGGECGTGNCVDGVCCNEPCTGVCEACSAPKSTEPNGTCGPIEPGSDPDNECASTLTCCGGGCSFC